MKVPTGRLRTWLGVGAAVDTIGLWAVSVLVVATVLALPLLLPGCGTLVMENAAVVDVVGVH